MANRGDKGRHKTQDIRHKEDTRRKTQDARQEEKVFSLESRVLGLVSDEESRVLSLESHLPSALRSGLLELFQQVNRQTWLPFVGTSMVPHIGEGNMLLVQHALHHIRLGDVIVFKRAGNLIAHRVVLIRKHGDKIIYQTKGDNARSFDVPVYQSSVLGRVICIQKDNGVLISLKSPYARLLNFALALSSYAAGILYEFAVSVLKHIILDF